MNLAEYNAAKSFLVGPILDADGVAKTDEVVASIKVTKNGTVGAPHGSSTLTHNHTGHYVYAANAGDFSAVGEVEFTLNSGTNAMAPVKFQVVPANVYNSMLGTDLLDVSAVQLAGVAQSLTDLKDFADTGYDPAAHKVQGVVLADTTTTLTNTVTLANGAHGGAAASMNLASGLTANITGNVTGNLTGSVAAVTGAVGSVTGNVGGDVAGSVASVVGSVGSVAGVVPDAAGVVATALGSLETHGDATWATATGFATPTNITSASGIVLAASQHVIVDSGTITTVTNLTNWDKTGYSLAASQHVIVDSGTITTYTGNTPQTGDSYAIVNGTSGLVAIKGDTAAILIDSAELQTLWTTGGALDLLLKDAPSTAEFNARTLAAADYFVVTDYTVPPTTAQIKTALEVAGGSIALILADTNELQGDWQNGGRLDLLVDALVEGLDLSLTATENILADTNELQTDWANGGRLDLLLDAVQTSGAGSIKYTETVNDGTNPIEAVAAWVSTDALGTTIVAGTKYTAADGTVWFYLDTGTYYLWLEKSGYNFSNPKTITVS